MDTRGESSILHMKAFQADTSWIPTTPVKPGSPKPQPICINGRENRSVEANLSESERFPQGNQACQAPRLESGRFSERFVQDRGSKDANACYDWPSSVNVSRGFDSWEAAAGLKPQGFGKNLDVYNIFSMKNGDKWNNVSFGDLLALAHAGGAPAAAETACSQTTYSAVSNSFAFGNSHCRSRQFHQQSGNSALESEEVLLRPNILINNKLAPDLPQYEDSVLSRPYFDLNSPPRIIDAALIANISAPFTPTTPDPTSKAYRPVSNMATIIIEDTPGEVASNRIDENELNQKTEQFHSADDQPCGTITAQLQENCKSNKAENEGTDPSKTPQQKQRRKKHRPKVVIEGQPRTRKPRTSKPAGSRETTITKRKYVRKDGIRNPTTSPSEEITNGTNNETHAAGPLETPTGKRKYVRRKAATASEEGNGGTNSETRPPVPEEIPTCKRKYVRRKAATPSEEGSSGINSETRTPASSETRTGKRKYVARKVPTPPEEGSSGTNIGTTTVSGTKRSCRRSLNFDIESLTRDDESSSCRPFSTADESSAHNLSEHNQSNSTVHLGQGMWATEKTDVSIACPGTHCTNQLVEGYPPLPGTQFSSPATPKKTDASWEIGNENECTRGRCQITFSDLTHDKEVHGMYMMKSNNVQHAEKSLNNSNCSTSDWLTQETHLRVKRQHWWTSGETELVSLNEKGAHQNSLQAYQTIFNLNGCNANGVPSMYFPAIYKKKRTEKGQTSAKACPQSTETNFGTFASPFDAISTLKKVAAGGYIQEDQQHLKSMLALRTAEGMTKKRSKGLTRVRDLDSLLEMSKALSSPAGGAATSIGQGSRVVHQEHKCMETLSAAACDHNTPTTKKRSKRGPLNDSIKSHVHPQFLTRTFASLQSTEHSGTSPIGTLVEQIDCLDINAEGSQVAHQEASAYTPYSIQCQEQNALILYQRDGTVVPFEGSFDPIRKRRPRPKVDLDDETSRVWKLLLADINSQGIDGTDEQKAKWWEEERRVFRGRADSFIARMHLVQGDRRFSPWKGSVLDSVIGVFLTQNVSDHLSSSAFMSLAAQFPLKPKSSPKSNEERSIIISEPKFYVLDPDDTIGWQEEKSNQQTFPQGPMTFVEMEGNNEKEDVNSSDSLGNEYDCIRSTTNFRGECSGSSKNGPAVDESEAKASANDINEQVATPLRIQRDLNDILSSQNSETSSQNSVDNSFPQTAEGTESSMQTSLEAEATARSKSNGVCGSTSFIELLQRAGAAGLHGVWSGDISSSTDTLLNLPEAETKSGYQNKGQPEDPVPFLNPLSSCSTSNSGARKNRCFDTLQEPNKFQETYKEKQHCPIDQNGSPAESSTQVTTVLGEINSMNSIIQKSPNEDNSSINNHQSDHSRSTVEHPYTNVEQKNQIEGSIYNRQHTPGSMIEFTERTSITDGTRKPEHGTVESNSTDHNIDLAETINEQKKNLSKAKKVKAGKEKQAAINWDSLREQAEANGKRVRTANTIDSLDWEAVRCADVNEIAQTIKERGMNNMLAERIKDFLNRLVREHGSIDLEWLRDVQPDKAKEYLLSIRGLGLKSVECVRLLTLHHLAFPVDTNVGRIAVRLGWVPLQPLPESLQLHLLELYPVLESIQKYLWPRLCKLDQRTLYELHYQMITFGKVFCTKSRPNCNACPMRGECRHFASAFASARLALPAPEARSIVSMGENREARPNPVEMIDAVQFPPLQLTQPLETPSEASKTEPIVEVPATPEPVIEIPSTPEPEEMSLPQTDIEDGYFEDPNEIPTIKLNLVEFSQNVKKFVENNMELHQSEMSKALVALTPDAASIPTPKLKNVSRLRTEHQVYELPDSHPLLQGLDKREPDDPCSYLLAIWTPGETANSIQPPESQCSSQESGKLCNEETCFSCNSIREANSQVVRGTLLIPCRTAMRGSFPLNGTYFQVNEVFADHESSLNPIAVPRAWIWNLPRRTVYFGTSIPTIFKGLSTESIQHCFWRGFVCVRGFDQKTRAPRPLMARLHFPASRLNRSKGRTDEN